ncbi:MAG: tetratricopeptide repeat protein [Gemmatimonadota bacterium]|nr:tetratricopeptide repeat protein [Gemmatimonadota bacterium]
MVRALASLIAAIVGCGDEATAGLPAFAGTDVCASCHLSEAEQWRGSHHDLAMQDATPETVLGDFGGARHESAEAIWTFSRTDGAYFARAEGTARAPDAEQAPLDYLVAYTFGFFPLQQYLVVFPDGRYQVLPIAWDTRPAEEGGQRWFDVRAGEAAQHRLAADDRADPGGDDPAQHWTGPDLTWNSMCAECHSTGLMKNYSPATDSFSTEWAELDVSCEACHGPGSEHVRWAEAVGADTSLPPAGVGGRDRGLLVHFEPHDPAAWTPDPATGTAPPRGEPDPGGQLDACGRCHSRRTAITTRYMLGDPLLDTHQPALLEDGLYFADGQVREEVYVWGSFVQSAMYRAGVSCNACHVAHSLEMRGEGNAVCTGCHAPARFDAAGHHFHEAGTEGALCVSCHMPARTYMGVDARRDHSFRVPDPAVAEAVGAPDPCTTCHARMTGAEAAVEIASRMDGVPIRRTEHHAEAIAAARQGDPRGLPGLYAALRDPKTPAITRATALTLLGADPSPQRAAAVQRGVRDTSPIVRIGALRGIRLAPTPELAAIAVPLLKDPVRSVRLAAAEAVPMSTLRSAVIAGEATRGANSGAARGADPAGAPRAEGTGPVAEYREAQLASAERPEAQLNLAWLALALGAPAEAEEALETAIALDPAFVPAYVNLADFYFRTGRDTDGEPLLRSAIEKSPGSADAHHALGLLLVRSRRPDEAIPLLQRAAELEGQGTRYAYVYAVALQSAGDTATARAVLEQALERRPLDRDLLLALAVLHREAGRVAEALRYARALAEAHPFDPAGPALIAELER